MVNRRKTLLAMIGVCSTGLAHAAAGALLDPKDDPHPASSRGDRGPADSAPSMQADLASLGSHEYSDEGIPVFLACIDLVAEQAGAPVAPSSPLSKRVAADLRRYGDAWQHMHPDAPDSDASKVIEVLAQRDFARGRRGGAP